MKWMEGLRQFCDEISADRPTPGGGSAAAAAGAASASLLAMVCGLSRRAKSQEAHWHGLDTAGLTLLALRDELLGLSLEDAHAYDLVLEAMRTQKTSPDKDAGKLLDLALRHAAEVPGRTAGACVRILDLASEVAEMSVRSAWSDVGVAVLLAEAGFKGAAMNVKANLREIRDCSFAQGVEGRLSADGERVARKAKQLLARLEG